MKNYHLIPGFEQKTVCWWIFFNAKSWKRNLCVYSKCKLNRTFHDYCCYLRGLMPRRCTLFSGWTVSDANGSSFSIYLQRVSVLLYRKNLRSSICNEYFVGIEEQTYIGEAVSWITDASEVDVANVWSIRSSINQRDLFSICKRK